MKKYIFILFAILVFASCKDYLVEIPKTAVSIETSFDTYDHAIKAVSALYAKLGTNDGLIFSGRFMMPSIINMGTEESKKFNWNSSTPAITSLWKNYYF